MVPPELNYEVGIVYCDDTNFTHQHEDVAAATAEYVQMITEAVAPSNTHPEGRHVREVSLTVFDDGEAKRFVESGVIACEDRPNA